MRLFGGVAQALNGRARISGRDGLIGPFHEDLFRL